MNRKSFFFFLLTASFLFSGCQSSHQELATFKEKEYRKISHYNIAAADNLFRDIQRSNFGRFGVVVTTLVNMDDLTQTSSFGRLAAEQISARLSDRGLKIRDFRFSGQQIFVDSAGEYALSRNVLDVAAETSAAVVVTGTYTTTNSKLYVVARAIETDTQIVVGAFNYEVDLDFSLMDLLDPYSY